MDGKSVTASELKAHCSQVIDEVARQRRVILVTRRGRPVARLVPVDEGRPSLFGFAKGCITVRGDLLAPFDADWEAAR